MPLLSRACSKLCRRGGHRSCERHYYISSLPKRVRAKRMAGYMRGHGSVENNLHWQLDISFNEDRRRTRKDHGAETFSRLCRIALNLLKSEKTLKVGIAAKRKNLRLGRPLTSKYYVTISYYLHAIALAPPYCVGSFPCESKYASYNPKTNGLRLSPPNGLKYGLK